MAASFWAEAAVMAALTDPETVFSASASYLQALMAASFWAEAAVMAALTDPETVFSASASYL